MSIELPKAAHDATMDYHNKSSFEEKIILCGQYSLINSLKNLQTFPWISERVKQNSLSLHAWNFDLSKGILKEYDEKGSYFRGIIFPYL